MTLILFIAEQFGYTVCSNCRKFTPFNRQYCVYYGNSNAALSMNFCYDCYPLFTRMEEMRERDAVRHEQERLEQEKEYV